MLFCLFRRFCLFWCGPLAALRGRGGAELRALGAQRPHTAQLDDGRIGELFLVPHAGLNAIHVTRTERVHFGGAVGPSHGDDLMAAAHTGREIPAVRVHRRWSRSAPAEVIDQPRRARDRALGGQSNEVECPKHRHRLLRARDTGVQQLARENSAV